MCPHTTLECVLLEIWLHRPHNRYHGRQCSHPILSEPAVINALDLALSCHIQPSSASSLFVLKALAALDKGSPLFTHASILDWSYDNGHLYFCNCLFVPPSAQSALLHSIHSIHSSPLSGHMGIFHTKAILEWDFWWPGLSTFVKHFIVGCAVCQQNKVNTHPSVPLCLSPFSTIVHQPHHCYSRGAPYLVFPILVHGLYTFLPFFLQWFHLLSLSGPSLRSC